jgi:GNAT superfamily N-acetyltransferase
VKEYPRSSSSGVKKDAGDHSAVNRQATTNRTNEEVLNSMNAGETGLRVASSSDLDTIIRHRRCMFSEMGHRDEAALERMETTSAPFIKAGLADGSYRGWLVENADGVVAGGGVVIVGYPSAPHAPRPCRAWILNMYTEPKYRGRGLAKLIMEAMISWCREQGFEWVSLHASDAGRHLYEKLGFKPTNEMRLVLK